MNLSRLWVNLEVCKTSCQTFLIITPLVGDKGSQNGALRRPPFHPFPAPASLYRLNNDHISI